MVFMDIIELSNMLLPCFQGGFRNCPGTKEENVANVFINVCCP